MRVEEQGWRSGDGGVGMEELGVEEWRWRSEMEEWRWRSGMEE